MNVFVAFIMTEQNVSRRGFLNVAVTAIVVGVVAGVGGYYAGLMSVAPSTITNTLTSTLPASTITQTVDRTQTVTQTVGAGTTATSTTTVTRPTTVTVTQPTTTTVTSTTTTATIPIPAKPSKLVVQTWGGTNADGMPAVGNAFNAQYGIPLQVELMGYSSEGLSKIKTDYPNTMIDVSNSIPSVSILAKEAAVIAPLDESIMPNMKDIPDSLKVKAAGKIWSVADKIDCTLWCWNKEKFPKGLSTVANLLDPALKGRVQALPPANYAGGWLIALAYARGGSEFNIDPGFEFMKELAVGGYIKNLGTSDSQQIDSFARGEVWATWIATANLKRMQEMGIPVEAAKIYTDSKTAMDPEVMMCVDKPTAYWGMKFIDTLLSPAVSSTWCTGLGGGSPNPKATIPADIGKYILTGDEVGQYSYLVDPMQAATNLSTWQDRWDKEILPLIGT